MLTSTSEILHVDLAGRYNYCVLDACLSSIRRQTGTERLIGKVILKINGGKERRALGSVLFATEPVSLSCCPTNPADRSNLKD